MASQVGFYRVKAKSGAVVREGADLSTKEVRRSLYAPNRLLSGLRECLSQQVVEVACGAVVEVDEVETVKNAKGVATVRARLASPEHARGFVSLKVLDRLPPEDECFYTLANVLPSPREGLPTMKGLLTYYPRPKVAALSWFTPPPKAPSL